MRARSRNLTLSVCKDLLVLLVSQILKSVKTMLVASAVNVARHMSSLDIQHGRTHWKSDSERPGAFVAYTKEPMQRPIRGLIVADQFEAAFFSCPFLCRRE